MDGVQWFVLLYKYCHVLIPDNTIVLNLLSPFLAKLLSKSFGCIIQIAKAEQGGEICKMLNIKIIKKMDWKERENNQRQGLKGHIFPL